MPLFYFHIQDEVEISDPEGTELSDVTAVREYAVNCARSLLSQDVLKGEFNIFRRFEITDKSGAPVMTCPFTEAVDLSGAKLAL